jgi:peptidoglycan/LPS O-acetylase OafA/YrhL
VGEHRNDSTRIPAIDGLLGVAILFLLIGHLDRTAGVPVPLPRWGTLGITALFVVTGFVTTRLLVDERDRTGTISLPVFYARLALRLLPTMCAFAVVVAVLASRGVLHLLPGDALAALTYTMNFHATRDWSVGHLWALAVQAQFLFLWPLVVAGFGRRVALRVAVGAIVTAPLLRVGALYGVPSLRPLLDQAFPFVVDAAGTGCALALLRGRLWQDPRYRAVLQSSLFALAPVLLVVVYVATRDGRPSAGASLLVGWTAVNVGVALCLDWLVRFPASRVGRVVAVRPMVWLGLTSYSLYVWQQPFLDHHRVAWFTRFPVNIALAMAAGITSYHLVERPFLRLRSALIPRPAGPLRAGTAGRPASRGAPEC